MTDPDPDAHTVWEEHYAAKPRVWSGLVNTQLAEVVPQLIGTRALDLGCGEGADAIWLAERGWDVVAVDVSTTALARAEADAAERGLASRIDFQQHDLTQSLPDGPFDLVSAQFLHSKIAMDRAAILRRAAGLVAAGGTLLIVDHAAPPPGAADMHHHDFPSPEAVVAGLSLDESRWQRVRLDSVERRAPGIDGGPATWIDNVIQLRRVL